MTCLLPCLLSSLSSDGEQSPDVLCSHGCPSSLGLPENRKKRIEVPEECGGTFLVLEALA